MWQHSRCVRERRSWTIPVDFLLQPVLVLPNGLDQIDVHAIDADAPKEELVERPSCV
jgi:hypothetical protein